eukprot:c28040_g1_i1 orf=676-2226(-)
MDYDHSDTSGTDDDLPPSHPGRATRGGRVIGNGRAVSGTAYGRPTPEQMIRKLEQDAYTAVLRAFGAQSENITWAKERLMSELRKELRVSDEQHREFLGKVAGDATLRQIREWRPLGGDHTALTVGAPLLPDAAPSPAASASRKKQKTAHVSQANLPPPPPVPMLKAAPVPSSALPSPTSGKKQLAAGLRGKKSKGGCQPPMVSPTMPKAPLVGKGVNAGRGSVTTINRAGGPAEVQIDPWIGRRVKTRWPEDNAFYEAVITDYNSENGLHALTYGMNTDEEAWEWVNLKELSPRDLIWVDAPAVLVSGKTPPSGSAVAVGRGASGRGTRKTGGRGSLMSTGIRGKGNMKGPSSSFEKSTPPVVPPRNWRGSSENGVERKGSRQVQLPSLEALVKEVDKIVEEEDLVKLESAKRAAKEHEEMICKALAEVGESSDEGDSDEEGQPPSSHTHSMERERERRSRQDSRDQHGDDEDETAGDGRCEGSDGEPMVGEGGVASDGDDEHQGEDGDDGDEDG